MVELGPVDLDWFVSYFAMYALLSFYAENFTTSKEISDRLFGCNSDLKDVDSKLLWEEFGSRKLHTTVSTLANEYLRNAEGLLQPNHTLSVATKDKLKASLFDKFMQHKGLTSSQKTTDPTNPPIATPAAPGSNNRKIVLIVVSVVVLLAIAGFAAAMILRRR